MSEVSDTEVHDSTIRALRQTLAQGGEQDASLAVHLASVLVNASRHAEALAVLGDAILDDPGHVDALELAACALRVLGKVARADRYQAAAQRLQSAPTEEPSSAVVLRLLPRQERPDGVVTLQDVAGMEKVKRRLQAGL